MFPGARGFDGGVQCQNIGLEGNAVDNAGDVGNLLRAVGDFGHRADDVVYHPSAAIGCF
ncbi:hypothetical protein D3C86_2151130 [compost metagenome]